MFLLFSFQLSSLYECKPPISRAKMTQLTKLAIKAIKLYKHVVQSVEKFIQKVRWYCRESLCHTRIMNIYCKMLECALSPFSLRWSNGTTSVVPITVCDISIGGLSVSVKFSLIADKRYWLLTCHNKATSCYLRWFSYLS